MEKRPLPELLAPAGSPEALRAAVKGGADAVYLGGTLFNARMNAKNFDRPGIADAVAYCHDRGVKVYVTFNTLIFDRQMKEALDYAYFLYKTGVDALIITDLGLASLIHRYLPDFPLHASTQCSGHNAEAAKFLARRGFTRMVCARELSKTAMESLHKDSPIEIEAFVHGALCVSHSGQCLMSSMIGGRSGNFGLCAQPCRMPYGSKYPLSLKDNCLAGHITELIDMGIASLKLEGRMKSPDYVYSTVSSYRLLLDERRDATKEEIDRMAKVFSRDGFTDGYYTGRIGRSMLGIRTDDNKTATLKVTASEAFREKIRKSDGEAKTPILPPQRKAELPEGLFKSLSLKKSGPVAEKTAQEEAATLRTARFYRPSSIPDGKYKNFFSILYLPLDRFDGNLANGVLLPPVITDPEIPRIQKRLREAVEQGAVHALVGNIGHIALAKEAGLRVHGDFRLNLTNKEAAKSETFGEEMEDLILSPELILPQIRDIPSPADAPCGVIVYGRLPLMLLEKPVFSPDSPDGMTLRDRKGVEFPILKEGGRDLLFNGLPIYMADEKAKLDAAGIRHQHFIFTLEGKRETEAILDAYKKGLTTKKAVRRIK